jgi:hypothetical protein
LKIISEIFSSISDENVELDVDIPIEINDEERSHPAIDVPHQSETSNEIQVLDEPGASTSTATNIPIPEITEPALVLDKDIMDILGNDPTTITKFGKDTNAELAIRLEHYCTSGLSKEVRKEFCEKYLIPNNCKLIDAPQLNAEIKAGTSEIVIKRDKYIENRQKQLATTLSCLSEALTLLFSAQNKDTKLIQLVMDAVRNLCDCQYNDSITRRSLILSSLRKEMKEQLQSTKLSNFLFGDNLVDTIRTAKAINKSGAELKALPPPKAVPNKKFIPGPSKNWKAQLTAKKPPAPAQKKKDPAAAPPKNRPSNSYKPSQHRQNSSRR